MLNNDKYYEFGSKYFGPFLYGYTIWLRKKLEEKVQIKKLFFFSRDGYMMKKAYDLFEAQHSLGLKSEYVYFSRNSIRQALLWNTNDFKQSLKYLTKNKYVSVMGLLKYYGFSKEEAIKIANDLNVSVKMELLFDYSTEVLSKDKIALKLYQTVENTFKIKSKVNYDNLKLYLDQIDMIGQCAIVDIGWQGSMQYYLNEFSSMSKRNLQISGYYVGMYNMFHDESHCNGYLFDNTHTKMRKDVLSFLGVYERLFQSLEGSTLGYENKMSKIYVIKDLYEYYDSPDIQGKIQAIQDGALNFISKKVILNEDVKNEKELAQELIKIGKYPTLKVLNLFSFFYNIDGNKAYYLPQKKLYQYTPKEFACALSNSPWKTGFMKAAFKIPFPYYAIYNMLKK